MPDPLNENIQSETIVVTTEQGVVMTGSSVQAFEARVVTAIRRPFYLNMFIQGILFIMLIGLGLVLSNINDAATSTDHIVKAVTGPRAQQQQTETLNTLLAGINCQDQKNLQKLIDNLKAAGATQFNTLPSLVDPSCP